MESSRVDVLYVTCRWHEIGWSVVGKNSPVLYIIVAYVCVCECVGHVRLQGWHFDCSGTCMCIYG